MVAAKTDKPTPVDFDLDSLEYDEIQPCVFTFHGKRYTVQNPGEVQLSKLESLTDTDVLGVLKIYLGDDQYRQIVDDGLLNKHAGKLMEKVQEHFTNLSEGEGDAS